MSPPSTSGDFLSRLVTKATGRANDVVPRLPSVFEPPTAAGQPDIETWSPGNPVDIEPALSPEATATSDRAWPLGMARPAETGSLEANSVDIVRTPSTPPAPALDVPGPSDTSRELPVAPITPPADVSPAYDRAPLRESEMSLVVQTPDRIAASGEVRRRAWPAPIRPVAQSRATSGLQPDIRSSHPASIARDLVAATAAADQGQLNAAIDAATHPGAVGIMVPTAPLNVVVAGLASRRRPGKGPDAPSIHEPEPARVVNVTIGRVEVRAVTDEPAAPRSNDGRRRPTPMGLDQYLRQRGTGR